MLDDELDQDDLEVDEVEESDEIEPLDDLDDSVDDGDDLGDLGEDDTDEVVTPKRAKKTAAISEDALPSVETKKKERDALALAMEEFLSRGGKVQEVDSSY